MNRRQYEKFKELMNTPLSERITMARHAQGEMQIILSYDPKPAVVEALLENQSLTPRNIVNLVRRRILTDQHLEKISANQNWISNYDVKFELIKNPKTPAHISLKLLRFMYRKELQAISRDVAIPQTIRHASINKLKGQLGDLTIGEKITLAREAVGPLLTLLLFDPNDVVVQTVLNNAMLRETEVIMTAHKKDLPDHIILAIYQSRWIKRYPVRAALVNNVKTPYKFAVDMIPSLMQQDLQKVIHNSNLPVPTRVMARNMLKMKISQLSRKEHIRLARDCNREIINILIEKEDLSIIKSLEANPFLLEGQMVSLAVNTKSRTILAYLVHDSAWRKNRKILQALYHNPGISEKLRTILEQRMQS